MPGQSTTFEVRAFTHEKIRFKLGGASSHGPDQSSSRLYSSGGAVASFPSHGAAVAICYTMVTPPPPPPPPLVHNRRSENVRHTRRRVCTHAGARTVGALNACVLAVPAATPATKDFMAGVSNAPTWIETRPLPICRAGRITPKKCKYKHTYKICW